MNTLQTRILLAGSLILATACATALPPKELSDARASSQRASEGMTAQLNPADLHTARESLQKAEATFADEGDTQRVRDQSYVAYTGFLVAESRARTMSVTQQRDQAVETMHANVAAEGEQAAADRDRVSGQLSSAQQQLSTQGQALQTEKERRIAAEKSLAQAAADLARLGSVKQEPRGMVLTLSGGVLFATNESKLLPSAQVKLNEVANVLVKQDPDSKIVVEGFTDSQGTTAHNQDLSQRRAQSVREYLVSRGVASDRISASGFGPSRPVADNSSAEGRANNRRVEIVVQPSSKP
jgi:outer membrane protein OmpA-like peptidoglycan-associated protein